MATYHLSSQIIKRSEGRSAVACAAYRSGEALHDEREGMTFTFKRQDRVVSSEIIAPEFATSPWSTDRAAMWNSLEAVEKRKDAQLAQEVTVALPNELTLEQQRELLAGWIDEHFTKKGFVADVNIHKAPHGARKNDHAHVQRPLRAIDPETGDWRKTKDRQESKEGFQDARSAEIEELRASWAKHVNASLERAGIEESEGRVDHRSHAARGIVDALPTIHEGHYAQLIEKRGGRSDRAEINRQIHQQNRRILDEIKTKVAKARAELAKYRDHLTRTLSETIGNQLAGLNLRPTVAPIVKPTVAPAVVTAPAVTPVAAVNTRGLAEQLARGPIDLEPLRPKPDPARTKALADRLARGPIDLGPTSPAPAPMRPDKLAKGPADTAPKSTPAPAPKPVWQPSPMRPDKLPASPGPVDVVPPTPTPTPAPAPKRQEPAPAPIAAKPQPAPAKLPEIAPPAVVDVEAEKRKKAAHQAAWRQHGGGGGVGG